MSNKGGKLQWNLTVFFGDMHKPRKDPILSVFCFSNASLNCRVVKKSFKDRGVGATHIPPYSIPRPSLPCPPSLLSPGGSLVFAASSEHKLNLGFHPVVLLLSLLSLLNELVKTRF